MTGEQSSRPIPQDRCIECGCQLGAGYLCDNCDTVEVLD